MDFEYIIDREKGNCHIKNSYLITDIGSMRVFVKENLTDAPFNCRSFNSYIREWRAHNLLYKLHFKVERTKDVDLDINEPLWRRACYFILSLLYNGK